ncbi:MAG TPA: DUF1624 domain-containing protein [Gammaproteobacteria bacterium]|nr:DUF1624 domain-containing protein [Gammaproteobacteria bacterium]
MVVYHFSFDLHLFGLVEWDFYNDPRWIAFRTLILSLFLALVGVSLHLATTGGLNITRYLRRLVMVVLCAALVSLGSAMMFGQRWIFFGVLHFIALASVLGLLFRHGYWSNLILGLAVLGLGAGVRHPWFDHPWLQWWGMMTFKPPTEDYVPLFPWFGVVLLGLFLGRWVFGHARPRWLLAWRGSGALGRCLALGGRHSLAIYMLHQPVLIGVLALFLGLPDIY